MTSPVAPPVSPPRSNASTVSTAMNIDEITGFASLNDYLTACDRTWESSNHARAISPLTGVAPPTDEVLTQIVSDNTDGDPIETDASVFPWILFPNMPAGEYYKYAHFLIQATWAALNAEHPDKKAYFANGVATMTLVPLVGVRIGMVASMGLPSKSVISSLTNCFYYDPRRGKLFLKAASKADTPLISVFRRELRRAALPPSHSVELALSWSHVAPVLLTYTAPLHTVSSIAGAGRYVQKAVSEFFANTLSPDAAARAYLSSNLPWDSAENAAVTGYGRELVKKWALDPILAVTAERRIIVSSEDMKKNRARETQLRRSMARPKASVTMLPPVVTRGSARAFTMSRIFDDNASLATALMVDAPEDDEDTGSIMPDDSITEVGNPESRRFTQEDIAAIRSAGNNIIHGAPTYMADNVEPSVHW